MFEITPEQFKTLRHQLGLPAQKLADRVGVADGRSIRRYEAGSRAIPWEISQRLTRMVSGLPEFIIGSDPEENGLDGFFIIPRDWPEMIIHATNQKDGTVDLVVIGEPPPKFSQEDLNMLLLRATTTRL